MAVEQHNSVYIYMFNSPQFFMGIFGHSGIVFEDSSGEMSLYSLHPIKNEGEPFDVGTIAHIVRPEDAVSFQAFRIACMTQHEKTNGKSTRGILLSNGFIQWYERIRRVIRFQVSLEQWEAMRAYAQSIDRHTPRFNVISYSCQHFVNDVLHAGNVIIQGKHFSYRHGIVPNFVYHGATDRTLNVQGFQKIDFTHDGVASSL